MDFNNLLQKYLEGKSTVAEARQLFTHLKLLPASHFDQAMREAWEELQQNPPPRFTNQDELTRRVIEQIRVNAAPTHPIWRLWLPYAAATALLMIIGVTVWWASRPQLVYRTAYGETETVVLPDSTIATLNANSSIHYSHKNSQSPRKVILQGEAFFKVKPMAIDENSVKFIVHTDNLNIEVLGTEFNVHHRRGNTEVVLEEGKVRVSNESQEVILVPGERVELKEGETQLTKRAIELAPYTSWRNNVLVFENTSLQEIARLLEDNYNYRVVFEDTVAAKKSFQGTFPLNDISILLRTLEKSVDIRHNTRTLYISSND